MDNPSNELLANELKHLNARLEKSDHESKEFRGKMYKLQEQTLAQAVKTNGRVSALEDWKAEHRDEHKSKPAPSGSLKLLEGKFSVVSALVMIIVSALLGGAIKSLF